MDNQKILGYFLVGLLLFGIILSLYLMKRHDLKVREEIKRNKIKKMIHESEKKK